MCWFKIIFCLICKSRKSANKENPLYGSSHNVKQKVDGPKIINFLLRTFKQKT